MKRLLLLAAVLAGLLIVPATADAASSVTIRVGANGAAKLTTGGPNTVYVNLHGLADGSWAEALYGGTCAHLGTKIVSLPTLVVSGGIAKRTNTLTAAQASAGRRGVIRIAKGTTRLCAGFTPVVVPTPNPTPTPTPSPTATPTACTSYCLGQAQALDTTCSDGSPCTIAARASDLRITSDVDGFAAPAGYRYVSVWIDFATAQPIIVAADSWLIQQEQTAGANSLYFSQSEHGRSPRLAEVFYSGSSGWITFLVPENVAHQAWLYLAPSVKWRLF